MKHRAARLQASAKWRSENLGAMRKHYAKYDENNREARRQASDKRRAENPEAIRESKARYHAANPEVARRSRRNRRARKRNAYSEPYTLAEVAKTDRNRCGICGGRVDPKLKHPNPKSASLDHIVPLSKGGEDTKANIQLAHLACNLAKGATIIEHQIRLI